MAKRFFLGCSGWHYEHWLRRFYPAGLPSAKWLEFYAKHFNTAEVNSTYYRFPNRRMVQGWKERSPKNFIFTLKGNKAITHYKKFNETEKLVKNFCSLADLLEEKLGCILWQFPHNIHKSLEFLERAAGQLDFEKKNVFEFRHESWFCQEVYKKMRGLKLGFCNVSSLDLPATFIATAPFAYFRFHGTERLYADDYPPRALKRYAAEMKKLRAKEVFAYFNNDSNAYAVKNCLELKNC